MKEGYWQSGAFYAAEPPYELRGDDGARQWYRSERAWNREAPERELPNRREESERPAWVRLWERLTSRRPARNFVSP